MRRTITDLYGKPLSDRQRDILALLAEGLSTAAIAAKFNVTVDTVKSHLSSSYAKLGVASRLEAILECVRNGTLVLTLPAPGFNGSRGPYPIHYRQRHAYARNIESSNGTCVCGSPFLHPVHIQAAPGVPMPGSEKRS